MSTGFGNMTRKEAEALVVANPEYKHVYDLFVKNNGKFKEEENENEL